jgi:hypothetical protein
LYRTLARFYFARYKVEKSKADSDRADAYLGRSLRLDPEHAGSYRLRGAIYLAQQRLKHDDSGKLLAQAESNLRRSIAIDPHELGAYYNLAIVLERKGHVEEGVQLIRDVLGRLPKFPLARMRKYYASLALNQACDLYSVARKSNDVKEQTARRAEALKALKDGLDWMAKEHYTPGDKDLRTSIEREIKPGGDLADMPDDQKQELINYKP